MRTCTEASVEHAPARLQRELDRLRLPIANLTLLSVLLVITSEEHGLMQKNINRLKITEYITYFKTNTDSRTPSLQVVIILSADNKLRTRIQWTGRK